MILSAYGGQLSPPQLKLPTPHLCIPWVQTLTSCWQYHELLEMDSIQLPAEYYIKPGGVEQISRQLLSCQRRADGELWNMPGMDNPHQSECLGLNSTAWPSQASPYGGAVFAPSATTAAFRKLENRPGRLPILGAT